MPLLTDPATSKSPFDTPGAVWHITSQIKRPIHISVDLSTPRGVTSDTGHFLMLSKYAICWRRICHQKTQSNWAASHRSGRRTGVVNSNPPILAKWAVLITSGLLSDVRSGGKRPSLD